MPSSPISLLRAGLITFALIGLPAAASAQTMLEADFSGMVTWSRSSFQTSTGFTWGDPLTGHVVWDQDLVPVTPTPYNTALFDFALRMDPDNGVNPPADFTEEESAQAYIQWKDGAFNGFAYQKAFLAGGGWYWLSIQGLTWTVYGYNPATGFRNNTNYASGHIDSALTNVQPYDPNRPGAVVPEPVSMVLMGTGLLGLAAAKRRRRNQFSQA